MQKQQLHLGSEALVALPPSTGGWERHHSTEGFGTGPKARWTSAALREDHWNNSNTTLPPHVSYPWVPHCPSVKRICINPHRWRCTEPRRTITLQMSPTALPGSRSLPAAGIQCQHCPTPPSLPLEEDPCPSASSFTASPSLKGT